MWAIEISLGIDRTSSAGALFLIAFAGITYYVAEILLTGYYGMRSDRIGVKPVILYATIGAGIVLLLYAPSSLIFIEFGHETAGLLLMTLYLAIIHFIHGVFASAKVAPSLGFINHYSTSENRTLHMAWYDNAILYGRAAGIMFGGFLWIVFEVDKVPFEDQAAQIAKTFPILSILMIIAVGLVVFGLKDYQGEPAPAKSFSIKQDVRIAAKVMFEEKRRPMLLPWISIAALIGSASLWGPTVSFIVSGESDSDRGYNALLPIIVILVGLALPAPFWGIYADRKGRKKTLLIGLFGMPIAGVVGLVVGYPFYKDDVSISNPYLLLSIMPATFLFSALIPVLMGILGDTAEENQDGKVMSGYHFVIATGEIVGILIGGIVIALFSFVQSRTRIFGEGESGTNIAITLGFVLFEGILVVAMIIGIYRLPEESKYGTNV